MPEQRFVSTRQAADMLGVALRTVQLWVEAGVLRAWKTAGGHRRIPLDSVQELLNQRRQVTQPKRHQESRDDFRILLVEDDDALRKLFALTCESWGLPIVLDTAGDGFEGLVKLGQNRPDLLVTDLNMPGMDGLRMMHHLRRMPNLEKLEIIVVTALTPDQVREQGVIPKDVRVFSKPVPFDTLETMIADRIKHRKGRSR